MPQDLHERQAAEHFAERTQGGGHDAARRANGIWKRLVEQYEKPVIDPATEEALRDYVARRKAEIETN